MSATHADRNSQRERYVCAFRGRRDNYQVPLALAEAGQLDQFITDIYRTDRLNRVAPLLPKAVQDRFAFRHMAGIPDKRVRSLWMTTGIEYARHAAGISHRRTYARLDRDYSLAARDRARQTRSSLFLYSPYAWEAFTASYSHTPRRVLFQFHPHPDFERRVLDEDLRAYPEVWASHREETQAAMSSVERERNNWKHADLIICASSFTRRTLLEAGADPNLCKVIPYGVDHPTTGEPPSAPEHFKALFVGSGVQRKGLHHLIIAWKAAKLPPESQLTLICRNIDPSIAALVQLDQSIRLIRGISKEQLALLYQNSSLFVMPSLIEGFGQVYLEALAAGCPVLGTANSCLPDLGEEDDGAYICPPGRPDLLAGMLERLSILLRRDLKIRGRARACADRFEWVQFRCNLLQWL